MARLTREQVQEYEEELEYQRNRPIHIPEKQHASSMMDRIVQSAKNVGTKIQEVNNSPTGQAIRRFAERTNAQDGFGAHRSPPQVQGNARGRAFQPPTQQRPPVNQESVLHPGNRIYVMEGRVIASGGGQKNPQQQRRGGTMFRRGGLAQEDNDFDDDRGL